MYMYECDWPIGIDEFLLISFDIFIRHVILTVVELARSSHKYIFFSSIEMLCYAISAQFVHFYVCTIQHSVRMRMLGAPIGRNK